MHDWPADPLQTPPPSSVQFHRGRPEKVPGVAGRFALTKGAKRGQRACDRVCLSSGVLVKRRAEFPLEQCGSVLVRVRAFGGGLAAVAAQASCTVAMTGRRGAAAGG
jgi:hypothetical protein